MVYSFNPVRFAGIVFGLSLAGAALAALLRAALGIDPAAGVIAALPLIVAMALEARRVRSGFDRAARQCRVLGGWPDKPPVSGLQPIWLCW